MLEELSPVARLDREIEDTMGRIMSGSPQPGDFGRVSDLAARLVEMTEPPAFRRLDELLGAA